MMVEARSKIDFNANAELRKWPSLGGNRVSQAVHPYLVTKASHHLYEIHTAPQPPVVSAVLSGEQIIELARLRDFL